MMIQGTVYTIVQKCRILEIKSVFVEHSRSDPNVPEKLKMSKCQKVKKSKSQKAKKYQCENVG